MLAPSRSLPQTPNQLPSSSTSSQNASRDSEDDSVWSLPYASHSFSHSRSTSTSNSVDSPLVSQYPVPPLPSYSAHSSSESHEVSYPESSPQPLFSLPKPSTLPDPSQFPDPYPFRPHQYLSSGPPTLSSGGSSIASTRSSAAYTNSGSALASGDYGTHVQIASNDDDQAIGVGITSDDVVHLANQDPSTLTSVSHSRAPIDQSRWSQSYSASIRSRSSLVRSNSSSGHDNSSSSVQQKPHDLSWQSVDERDEVEIISDVSTEDIDLEEEQEEERTSAIVIVEEGRGLIVRSDGVAIPDLVVHPGTTHLLIGSSIAAGALPLFLSTVLPTINTTLLALDISANFLGALPPSLSSCVCLEELNVSSNPLRALPLFVSQLRSLRVLIADSIGLATLPPPLSALDKLHTLSIRRNRMYSLPSWLCLLASLQILLVDGNPFHGPWKALMEPLLAKRVPASPFPSTPVSPPLATSQDIDSNTDTDVDDSQVTRSDGRVQEDEDTITPARAPILGRAATAPDPLSKFSPLPSHGVTRTRTAPNSSFFEKNRIKSNAPLGSSRNGNVNARDSAHGNEKEIRRMKSAGELRQPSASNLPSVSPTSSPGRLTRSQYVTSASSSNLLTDSGPLAPRFATIGPQSQSPGRVPLGHSPWDKRSEQDTASSSSPAQSPETPDSSQPRTPLSGPLGVAEASTIRQQSLLRRKEEKSKEQSGRWGFLKKMSMGKLKPDAPASKPSAAYVKAVVTPLANVAESTSRPSPLPLASNSITPSLFDVRLSATGSLGMEIPDGPEISLSQTITTPNEERVVKELPPSPNPSLAPSSNLFTAAPSSPSILPPSPLTRISKRRSFLPIGELPPRLPSPGSLPSGTSLATTDGEEQLLTPSATTPETAEQAQRREEERAREAYTRSLRSVMAYLRDMNDLSVTQLSLMNTHTTSSPDITGSGLRSRRPTTVDSPVASDGTFSSPSSVAASRSGSSDQLRSPESIAQLRSHNSSQTTSIATTDSAGSVYGEERKFKDDGGRRMRVVKEIIDTERTYVKGLQELIDIYIKPAAAAVPVIVSSTKETVVPAAERRIVFSGLDSLFSFHKDIFLPALELAASPVLLPQTKQTEQGLEGVLSANAARGIARTFVSHAAFMRMYSTYINNFDLSVQRIKQWVSERPGTATGSSPHSPSLSMQATTGASNIASDPSGGPQLTASQRKRIKGYLKRCRLHPRHSQLNLEGYLLLPVQRIPRYRLLLEELARSTPPAEGYLDPLDQALDEISSLATNMNEGKRESESRSKLVRWQSRIRGKFPSPLVQPHRRLIMDGPLLLTRVVRKVTITFEVIDGQGDPGTIQVECLSPEQTPRSLLGILCNDLLVLCRDSSDGKDTLSAVDLWAVLRMQTLPQPASIVHGNVLRIVDNKAVLYFEASSTSVALDWFRAINLHIPTSKP
ncbi:hypothetical protein F5148DRAFT_1225326 [Russula earlei]|uniref:Uncharacterized protein n=1 Tax=Russula earlei TaxID=71964 RepID=A0ACC0U2K4_9AGAM|nr:hypothetical protein F5148DRAFT_1225326 [Russula earlei]